MQLHFHGITKESDDLDQVVVCQTIEQSQALVEKECDPDTFKLTRGKLRNEVGSDRYFGGLVFGKSAGMHVGRYGQGLAEAAARRGVHIYERAPISVSGLGALNRTATLPLLRFDFFKGVRGLDG